LYVFQDGAPDDPSGATSSEEVTESKRRISARPDADSFLQLIDTISRTNGKPHSAGPRTLVGDVLMMYLRLDQAGDKLMLCRSRTGPFFWPNVRREC
tara:strand:- start:10574 stop:10864 length:291 start_codon:yes stop_codon:yes gene_type:complete